MGTFPGDELVLNPTFQAVYREGIATTPDAIWPWLLQVGYHRGGWYIDTWWDEFEQRHVWPRLVPPEARGTYEPPADSILQQYQNLRVGDIVPDGPPGSAWFTVERLDPMSALVLYSTSHFKYAFPFLRGTRLEVSGAFSWAFVLEPIDARHTELTLVNRTFCKPRIVNTLFNPFYRVVDRMHQKEMLKGIKLRAEKRSPAPGAKEVRKV